ncbi:MAG: hypothetical protein ACODAQ_01140 [Phycisphaeraceae bacterium]
MLTRLVVLAAVGAMLSGCQLWQRDRAEPLRAPYGERQVWAVAPLGNESGTRWVDGARIADHITQQLENADGLDTVAVNRVLAAMESLEMDAVTSPDDAAALRRTLDVDGLVVGTVTAYDPYDPPKLGLAVELYTGPRHPRIAAPDVRELQQAATDESVQLPPLELDRPISLASGYFDAADADVRRRLKRYAGDRGREGVGEERWRLYRISMDLYTEFVSYEVSRRLLEAERQRLHPPIIEDGEDDAS